MANRTIGIPRSPETITGITANTTFVLPPASVLLGVYIRNRTVNTVTEGLRIGTAAGLSDVIDQINVVGDGVVDRLTTQALLKKTLFSMTGNQTLYIEARKDWNGASLDMQWFYARAGDDTWLDWLSGIRRLTYRPDVHKIFWDVLDKLNVFAISSTGVEGFGQVVVSPNGQLRDGSKTVAQLNAMTGLTAGDRAYCSNEAGGAQPVFYDGTNWRRVSDRAVIS